jgi:hypothetical protein
MLKYASKEQYARERVGMSLAALRARVRLAKWVEEMPEIGEAIEAGELGFEAAMLVGRVANPDTAPKWIDRAKRRTIKHLREEVEAVQLRSRVNDEASLEPPTDEELKEVEDFERAVGRGEMLKATIGPKRDQQISVSDGAGCELFFRVSAFVVAELHRQRAAYERVRPPDTPMTPNWTIAPCYPMMAAGVRPVTEPPASAATPACRPSTSRSRGRSFAPILGVTFALSSALLLQLGCRLSEAPSAKPVGSPPPLIDATHAPEPIEFVYVDGMSRVFLGFTASPAILIVWDVILFSDPDDAPSQPTFAPPPPYVWLLGPDEPCRAYVVETPLIDNDAFLRATTVSFEVRGCSKEGKWAPIALIADERTIIDMTWRPALPPVRFEGTHVDDDDDPVFSYLARELDAQHEHLGQGTLRLDLVHTATTPRVFEAEYGVLWGPQRDGCPADYTFKSAIGLAGDDHIVPFPFSSEDMWLAGAIAKGDAPAFIVLRDDQISAHVFVNGPFAANFSRGETVPVPTRPPDDEERVERSAPWACDDDEDGYCALIRSWAERPS